MALVANLLLVFGAGLVSAVTTGLGGVPFLFVSTVTDRTHVLLWGFASGIMVAASTFGLVFEGVAAATRAFDYLLVVVGLLAGAAMVVATNRLLAGHEFDPEEFEAADFRKLVLILGVMTVHSFPEGVAVGVAFAELDLGGGIPFGPFTVPMLAVVMTVSIAIHNIPEGVAISIPLQSAGVSTPKTVWWAVFSSLPQPFGAVLAFGFVRIALEFLPAGFGFAAGAMIYLVASEFIPDALEHGASLDRGGRPELVGSFLLGVVLMGPMVLL